MPEDPFASYEFNDSDPMRERAQAAADFLSKNKKKIILAVALIAIAYVAYQFLFAGFVDVTINVNDTEGASIVGNTIDVFSSDGKKLEFTGSGRGSYNFRA